MYKRKARVVFLDQRQPERARQAAALACNLAGDRLEGAHTFTPGWPDLMVLLENLDNSDDGAPPATYSGPVKRWRLPTEAWEKSLITHIHSMVGGMRMLARLDEEDEET